MLCFRSAVILSNESTHHSIGPPPTDTHSDWLRHQRNSGALQHPYPRATLAGPSPRSARVARARLPPAPRLHCVAARTAPRRLVGRRLRQRAADRPPSHHRRAAWSAAGCARAAVPPAVAPPTRRRSASASRHYLPGGIPSMAARRACRAAPAALRPPRCARAAPPPPRCSPATTASGRWPLCHSYRAGGRACGRVGRCVCGTSVPQLAAARAAPFAVVLVAVLAVASAAAWAGTSPHAMPRRVALAAAHCA